MLPRRYPGRLLEPLSGRAWTSEEVMVRVSTRAADYQRLGLSRGDRVFIHFGNCLEFFAELLAVWRLGGTAVPIDSRFTPFEIETLANWTRPRISVWNGVGDREALGLLSRSGVDVIDSTACVSSSPPRRGTADGIRLDDDALILFTSGTTGQPKGVVHTHRSLLARWTSLHDHLGLETFRRTLCLLPTHFGHGLICNCLFPWFSGQDLHILPPFKPEVVTALGDIVDRNNITFMSSVPAVWRLAQRIAEPPKGRSLQRIFVGSAPLSASLWQGIIGWSGGAEVMNAYGITETGSWLAGTTVQGFVPEDGLVGHAWGGALAVVGSSEPGAPNDPAAACPPGEIGHVWVRTPALMRGYLDREDLTARVVSDGWFLTGDKGLLDDRGWLYLRGREREEINKGGMKIYPADIDAVVERFPGTVDVCAFAFPDPLLGEDVGVAVVLDKCDDVLCGALYDWAKRHLAEHQMPRRWYVLREIPRTSRGKVNRTAVADQCAQERPLSISNLRRRSDTAGAGSL